jgi:hypothetical protein
VLTDAMLAPASPAPSETSGATTAGATSAAGAASGTQTYRLMANASALSPHVGKKLELTGTLEDPTSATAGAATSTAGATTTPAGSDNTPTLRVESGKIVAASCSQ